MDLFDDVEPVVAEDTTDELSDTDITTGGVKSELKVYPNEKVLEPDRFLHVNDMPTLILAELTRKGPAGDHITSMNSFYKTGIKQIITKLFKPEVLNMRNERVDAEGSIDNEIEYISFTVDFTGCELQSPTTHKYSSRHPEMLTPNMARLRNLNYSAPLFVAAKVSTTATFKNSKTETKVEQIKLEDKWRIASIPVMVKSELCHLHGQPIESLKRLEEDPRDPGGYFIIGNEMVVDKNENLVLNMMHGYVNRHMKEIARATFQSKPGDAYENSFYIVIKYLNDNQIVVQIVTNKHAELEIPFYLIFRAFGMTRDHDIVNNIVYGTSGTDQVTMFMMEVLERAFKAPNKEFAGVLDTRDSSAVMMALATKMVDIASNPKLPKDPNAVKYVNNRTTFLLDKYIFPHIGSGPATRIHKLKFMGHLIHKLLRMIMGVLPATDRDSYRNKRVHPAGVSIAKTFKTQFNFAIVQEIKKKLTKEFKNTKWSKVALADCVKNAINANDLERALIQSINTGEKTLTIKRNEVTNRISSQQLYHKNDTNVVATLNNITTHGASAAKATDRATDMRMAHNTYYGYIGMAQSADTGEKVGMNKQMTVTASVTEASASYVLKEYLLRDSRVLTLDKVDPSEINARKLTKIFVNGDWIGLCADSESLVRYYRTARRYGDINRFTTIVWELLVREVYFWVDVGRLVRPLVIVYNNHDEFVAHRKAGNKTAMFTQWITLTHDHIIDLQSGAITMTDLMEQRVIEYIAPEESENALIARSIEVLAEHIHDFTTPFTHCGIEQDVFGIVELSAPNTNHTPASRITMFTNHKKQTCGWFALNWPYRIDKNTFLQYYCERPIVSAFSNAVGSPNAQNVILAYTTSKGFGQEDSLEINRSAVDLGLFNGSHFYYEMTELEADESFGNPDYARTIDFKKDAIYEYVDERGFVRPGTEVRKGYVLIVKRAKLKEPNGEFLYTDRSITYKSDEPAIVESVITPRNEDDVLVAKVKLRSTRPLGVGDKLSSHSGCKGIDALMSARCDMPYCSDGTIPDIIINPHSVPTRMVIGQIIETLMGELAAQRGCIADGTPFRKRDPEAMIAELATKYGIEYGGHRRMFNGRTGNWYDSMIFCGPTSYQRLQKFVKDENYAMSTGPTCALTRQPLDGKTKNGGLRIGEMEKDTIVSHGAMRTLYTKFYQDSDGIDLYVCRICGSRAVVNEKISMYKCKNCKDNADIANVPSSWVANLFFNEMNAMGVKTTFELEPLPR